MKKKGGKYVNEEEIIKTLEKQLLLLSERSSRTEKISVQELLGITRVMNETAGYLLSRLSKAV